MKQIADDGSVIGQHTSSGFLTLAEFALVLFGTDTRSTKARVVRMADRGELATIRIGRRGDRLFPAAEVDRLHADADLARKEAAERIQDIAKKKR